MYLTLKEAAEYLSLPEQYIQSLIQQGKIRTVFDGEQYVVNKEQFLVLQVIIQYQDF